MPSTSTRKVVAKWIGFIVLVWLAAFAVVEVSDITDLSSGDLISIMFGAASLALFIFSIFLAVLAVIGWQTLRDNIREQAENAASEKVKTLELSLNTRLAALENELRGRAYSTMGFLLAEISLDPIDHFKVKDQEKFLEALRLFEIGIDYLQRNGGGPQFMAINNFIHYSLFSNSEARAGYLIELAQKMKKEAQARNVTHILITACGAIIRYGRDAAEIEEARKILEEIVQDPRNANSKRKEEAEYYLGFGSASLKQVEDPTNA